MSWEIADTRRFAVYLRCMAKNGVAMETKLLAVFTAGLGCVQVTDLCTELGVSRQTFYKYRRRFVQEGPAGLVERSRAPLHSPNMISAELEDEIVRLRKTLPVDNGAQSIAYQLKRDGHVVPAVATIHRALVRRGLIVPQPHKRPRSSWRRFEWSQPNDAWQIDATAWLLRSGRQVWIMDLLDDHSRMAVAARACTGPTGEAAWDAFCRATEGWGVPAHVMSDNGICFTHRLHGDGLEEAAFERDLRLLGVGHIPSSPGHPQTCGKIERFHQTLKAYLRTQRLARTLSELQAQIDWFVAFYNQRRPHRALRGDTPAERWDAAPKAGPGEPISREPYAGMYTVYGGRIDWHHYQIGLGAEYTGQQVVVLARDLEVAVFGANGLIRRLRVDSQRRYQPTGKPAGRRKKLKPC